MEIIMGEVFIKNEIGDLLRKYEGKISFVNFSTDDEFCRLLSNLNKLHPFERPDAWICLDDVVYAVEHFQISQYRIIKKNQDISRIAEGSKENRDKMKDDRDFEFEPSIGNLINSMSNNIRSHSKSFESYRKKILDMKATGGKTYKLVLFVEDTTNPCYIVKKRDTKPVNPISLLQIADIFSEYRNDVWGLVYAFGNGIQEQITGCTIKELMEKRANKELLDAKNYVPFEFERNVHVSKTEQKEDCNSVEIRLYDEINMRESLQIERD